MCTAAANLVPSARRGTNGANNVPRSIHVMTVARPGRSAVRPRQCGRSERRVRTGSSGGMPRRRQRILQSVSRRNRASSLADLQTSVAVTGPGSQGGASDEAGGAYRRAVAAFFAAYGLNGLPYPGLPLRDTEAVVEGVALETDFPVDDVMVQLRSGRLFLQAKRTLRFGRPMDEVTRQWLQAVRNADFNRSGDFMAAVANASSRSLSPPHGSTRSPSLRRPPLLPSRSARPCQAPRLPSRPGSARRGAGTDSVARLDPAAPTGKPRLRARGPRPTTS